MKTSDAINEIAAALAKAQGQIEGAAKGKENPHFRSKYADLASVWDACRAALSANGLSVVQMTDTSQADEVIVDTRLLHSSGQWIEGRLALPVSKTDAQGYGSALTYARRYGLSAAVGVAPEDDDGNLATSARPAKNAAEKALMNGSQTGSNAAKEAFEAMPEDERVFLRDLAKEVEARYTGGNGDGGKIALDWIEGAKIDHDEKLALWSLLSAPTRSAIKKAQAARDLATQP